MKFALCVCAFLILEVTAGPVNNTQQNSLTPTPVADPGDQNWWKNAVFYQIYPRSFLDANNDGVGDLQGIIQKLDHLVDIGVTAVWLSPIYKSPMKDFGYDISNFRDIDPTFGTMDDFDQLVAAVHDHNLKLIMDFVPNHSSDQHEWFQNALAGEEKYKKYYIWRDGKADDQPPANWISNFHGPAWTKPEGQTQYYLHQFHVGQPDLDFRNDDVKQEMLDILTFWLDKGVDGFRVDTIPSLVEAMNSDGTFEDEALTNNPDCTPNDRCYLTGDHQSEQPETFKVVYDWRALLDKYVEDNGGDARIMMTETYSTMENILKYYGDQTDPNRFGAHFSFNFRFITDVNKESNAKKIVDVIDEWYLQVQPKDYVSNWVLGNHDQHRLASRYGVERADGMILLQMILPGVGVTYMGEEIGMENGEVTFAQGQDPQGLDAGAEGYAAYTRDFERTPFHWDKTVNAGFNTGAKTWLPVSSKYVDVNVAAQKNVANSPLETYKALIELRSNDAVKNGDFQREAINDEKVLKVVRSLGEDGAVILLMNLGEADETIDLATELDGLSLPNLLMVRAASRNSDLKAGHLVSSTTKLTLKPSVTIILKF